MRWEPAQANDPIPVYIHDVADFRLRINPHHVGRCRERREATDLFCRDADPQPALPAVISAPGGPHLCKEEGSNPGTTDSDHKVVYNFGLLAQLEWAEVGPGAATEPGDEDLEDVLAAPPDIISHRHATYIVLVTSARARAYPHNLRSRLRYWMASATWGMRISAQPARSAMVRESFRMRS